MNRTEILPYVEVLISLLADSCERIQVAGSVRREKAEVHDLEIVAIPKPTRHLDLLGDPIPGKPTPLDETLATMMQTDSYWWDEDVKRNGPRYKRFVTSFGGTLGAVDLFLADSENWGNQLAIRTGSASFSRWFMTARSMGGGMPWGKRQAGGYLWSKDSDREEHFPNGYVKILCPEEADFFRAIGLPVLDPKERNEDGINKIRRMLGG